MRSVRQAPRYVGRVVYPAWHRSHLNTVRTCRRKWRSCPYRKMHLRSLVLSTSQSAIRLRRFSPRQCEDLNRSSRHSLDGACRSPGTFTPTSQQCMKWRETREPSWRRSCQRRSRRCEADNGNVTGTAEVRKYAGGHARVSLSTYLHFNNHCREDRFDDDCQACPGQRCGLAQTWHILSPCRTH